MEPGAVSSFPSIMEMVVTHYGMLSVRIIMFHDKKLWRVRRGGKLTNIVSRGNISGIWKGIRGVLGHFVRAGTTINGNGREIQI